MQLRSELPMLADGVVIGDRVKVQNNVSLHEGTQIERRCFLGALMRIYQYYESAFAGQPPAFVRNDPRPPRCDRWGKCNECVCGVTIGRYAFVGAGAVVREDVPDYALILGVPGKHHGWMSRHGHRLDFGAAPIWPSALNRN